MLRKIIPAAALAAVLGVAGVANADPLRLDDAQLDSSTAGGFAFTFKGFKVFGKTYYDVYTDVDLDDNLAVADATADAFGFDTLTGTHTSTVTTWYSSSSSSSSISATD